MTVIAYSARHRVMASDSIISDAKWRASGHRKITRLRSGALLGVAGDADARDFVALLAKATPRRMPTRFELAELKTENDALLVFRTGQIFVVTTGFEKDEIEDWIGEVIALKDTIAAIGSGAAYAYGALEAGRSPTDAVRIACRRDTASGLPVQWEGLTE